MTYPTGEDEEAMERMRHQLHRQGRIFTAINVVAAIAFAVLFYLSITNLQSAHRASAAIQTERREAILRNCQDTNQRHDTALKQLDSILKKSGVSGKRRDMARNNTLRFINALAPKRDCIALVEKTVNPQP